MSYAVNMESLCATVPFLVLEHLKHESQRKFAAARTEKDEKKKEKPTKVEPNVNESVNKNCFYLKGRLLNMGICRLTLA